jgi:hypothetical protein
MAPGEQSIFAHMAWICCANQTASALGPAHGSQQSPGTISQSSSCAHFTSAGIGATGPEGGAGA